MCWYRWCWNWKKSWVMNKKILIVHRSEMVRKGLSAILRSFFTAEVVAFATPDEMAAFSSPPGACLLLFAEVSALPQPSVRQRLCQNGSLKVVSVLPSEDIPAGELCADYHISLHTGSTEIHDLVASVFKMPATSGANGHEGEELTQREKDVLKLVALGHTNKDIGEKLFISVHTVISHRKNITEKLGIKSISGLTVYAILNKLIDPDLIDPEKLI